MADTTETTTDVTQMSAADLLTEVNSAMRAVLVGGQSYQIGSRKLTRADFAALRSMRAELLAEVASEGDTGLLDNTFVAYFEGR